jgi:hypothetical protein
MITPSENVLQAIEENFMVLPNLLPDRAFAAVTDTLDQLQTTMGYCPDCWGRGYDMTIDAGDSDKMLVPYCHCDRGKRLEELVNANLLSHRPN